MIKSDLAIKTKKQDLLGRYPYSEKLGRALLEWKHDEGFVVGLYGKWGTGKSSVINLAVDFIENETKKKKYTTKDKPIIIRFNPWNFTEQSHLIEIFFADLAKAIHYYDKGKDARKVGEKLMKYSKVFSTMALVPWFAPYTNVLEKVINNVGITTKGWGELQQKNIEEYKNEIDTAIKKLDRRLIIIIDDIDRLNEKEIKQIFQLVKQNANFPNTLYILSFDQQKALKEIKEEPVFLEKIIQVSFHVPTVEEQRLQKLLFAELDVILKPFPDDSWDAERWSEIYNDGFKSLFDTVRKINRYINSLEFNINLNASEINPLDFFTIEAIRVFFPTFYEEVANNKELFVGRFFLDNDRDRESRRKQFEKIFTTVPEDDRARVRGLIFHLFPQVSAVYRNQTERERDSWFTEKRICSEKRFGNYFYLTLPEGEISQSEIEAYRDSTGDPERMVEILERLNEEKKIRRFFERIGQISSTIPSENIYPFALAVLNFSNYISRERESDLDFGVEMQMSALIFELTKKLPKNERYTFLEKLIKNSKSIDIIVRVVSLEKTEHEKDGLDKIVEANELEQLIKVALEKIRSYAASGKLSKSPGFAMILYRWKNWESIDAPKKYISELINTPGGIGELLYGFTIQVFSSSNRKQRISFKELKEFADLEELKKRVSKLSASDKEKLSKEQNDSLDLFMKDVDKAIKDVDELF